MSTSQITAPNPSGRHVRITQLDGKLPNIALMRLSAWHKAMGDEVHFSRTPRRLIWEPDYSAVYGSAIFTSSAPHVEILQREFPGALVGGTGAGVGLRVETIIGDWSTLDYDLWPGFSASIGFTQRGCRFSCGFCVVPKKEGKPQHVATIHDIWRGDPHPRHLHLLDNDFFGQPKAQWKAALAEARDGRFKICFSQGVNIRVITDEISEELAAIDYRDDQFKTKRLYTAWDSLGDEGLFFRGVDRLERHGVRPSHLMVYMLVGYDPTETWAAVFHRFTRMVDRGIKPFPMVYGDRARLLPAGGINIDLSAKRLMDFQRWVNTGLYRRGVDFAAYDSSKRHDPLFKLQSDLFEVAA